MMLRFACALIVCSLHGLSNTSAKDLYHTDFENFTVGDDQLAGTDGWLSDTSNNGLGVHGIDEDIVTGLGKTAFLGPSEGTNRPNTSVVSVFRQFGYNPVTANTPVIQLEVLFGIEYSSNLRHDQFLISLFNSAGGTLGSIGFQNRNTGTNSIFRLDNNGATEILDLNYINGELNLLFVEMDYANSTWSASLNGLDLFVGSPFNPGGLALDLGFTAAQWRIPSGFVNLAGDNWMLIADWTVRAIPPGQDPFALSAGGINELNQSFVSWLEEPGFSYKVEYAEGSMVWTNGLPSAQYIGVSSNQVTYTDLSAGAISNRHYRVIRSVTP
jgi:hypothetical protein